MVSADLLEIDSWKQIIGNIATRKKRSTQQKILHKIHLSLNIKCIVPVVILQVCVT